MRSRKEQVQAHRFVSHRLISALLLGDPESTETPMRRIGLSVMGSVMVMAVIAAAFGIYGVFKQGGGKPEAETLIIEEETGVRYIYGSLAGGNSKPALYPVLNYSSARLILNKPDITTVTMSQNSLRDYPRGLPLGIPNAPDTLPLPENLTQGGTAWNVCSSSPRPAASGLVTQVVVQNLTGGESPADKAVLVQDSAGKDEFLLLNNKRYHITAFAKTALGITNQPLPVTKKVIDALPAGPDLDQIRVTNAGGNSNRPVVGSTAKVGAVFTTSGKFFVLTDRGLIPVGAVAAKLLGGETEPIPASASDINSALAPDAGGVEKPGFPQEVPVAKQVTGDHTAVCGVYTPGTGIQVMTYGHAPEDLVIPDNTPLVDAAGLADRVVLPGGRGVLAQDQPTDGSTAGQTIYLINQQGNKYGLVAAEGSDPKAVLGYASVTPVLVPGSFLNLLPSGVALSRHAALQKVIETAPDQTPDPAAS